MLPVLTGIPTDWLLDSDPALRWQVERDLLGEPPRVWEATRARVA
ncbi:squalene cyclase, partial [Pseudonocardia sp. KRD-169]|nr:squalene cyclase [Pseudonocardia abyssalis]